MSNHSDHEQSEDDSQETRTPPLAEDPIYCCRVCQLEADGEPRASAHTSSEQQSKLSEHDTHTAADEATTEPESYDEHAQHGHDSDAHKGGHGDHGDHTDHSGREAMFRRRFWVSLVHSVPVIFFSEFIQEVFDYTAPSFPGSVWITPVLSTGILAPIGILLSPAIGAVFMSLSTSNVAINARHLRGVDLA